MGGLLGGGAGRQVARTAIARRDSAAHEGNRGCGGDEESSAHGERGEGRREPTQRACEQTQDEKGREQMSIEAGVYRAQAVAGSEQYGQTSKGTDQIVINMDLLDVGEQVSVFLYF